MNIPAVPKPETPAFIDKVITQVQDILKAKLSWLDYSFGQSQRLVTTKDKKEYFYPGIHLGDGKYINVLPDQELGNYSFFITEDPQTVDFKPHTSNSVKLKYSIVFWVNLDKIFNDDEDRNTESLKAQILKVLTKEMFLAYGRIDVKQIFEKAENIYKGYSLREVNSQFLMQPYAGFRFEGEMLIREAC